MTHEDDKFVDTSLLAKDDEYKGVRTYLFLIGCQYWSLIWGKMLTEQNNFLCVAVGSISTQKNKSMELFMTASSAAEDHHNSLKAELHQQFSDQTRLILQLTNKVIVSFTYFYAAAVPQLPFLWYSAFHRINCKA